MRSRGFGLEGLGVVVLRLELGIGFLRTDAINGFAHVLRLVGSRQLHGLFLGALQLQGFVQTTVHGLYRCARQGAGRRVKPHALGGRRLGLNVSSVNNSGWVSRLTSTRKQCPYLAVRVVEVHLARGWIETTLCPSTENRIVLRNRLSLINMCSSAIWRLGHTTRFRHLLLLRALEQVRVERLVQSVCRRVAFLGRNLLILGRGQHVAVLLLVFRLHHLVYQGAVGTHIRQGVLMLCHETCSRLVALVFRQASQVAFHVATRTLRSVWKGKQRIWGLVSQNGGFLTRCVLNIRFLRPLQALTQAGNVLLTCAASRAQVRHAKLLQERSTMHGR